MFSLRSSDRLRGAPGGHVKSDVFLPDVQDPAAGLLLSGLLKTVLDTEPLKGLVGGGAAQAQGVPAQRAEEGTEENPMDEALLESIREEPAYEKAVELRDRILAETDIAFPKTEQDFLSVHLCNLLS